MTAKRFKIVGIEEELYPMIVYYDGDKELGYDEVCELLNELHEENTMLKERRHEDINDLSVIAMKYKALEKENEQLKESVYSWSKSYSRVYEEREYWKQQAETRFKRIRELEEMIE